MLKGISTRELVYTSLMVALTSVGGLISINLGPVAFSLQSFFVIISGSLLGPKLGAISQLLYISLGLLGLPIFSGGNGGLQRIVSPSFGFLIGFIFAAYTAGVLVKRRKAKSFSSYLFIGIISHIPIYSIGLPYMYIIMNHILGITISISELLVSGFLVFLIPDAIKILIIAGFLDKILDRIKIN